MPERAPESYHMTLPGMASRREPFVNLDWRRPFLPALLDMALDVSGNNPEDVCFIFPHARPALYLTELLKHDPRVEKPCILPRMLPVGTLFSLARGAVSAGRGANAGMLDQVALLLQAIRDLREERGGLLRDLPLDDSRRFFPWGVRLASLMEELFTHNVVPEDYIYMEDMAAPFAAVILENLGALHARYQALLDERGWTTPGLDAFLTARALDEGDFVPELPALAGKRIFLAGFHTLTGSQNKFFRHLWAEHGATVCLHADEAVTHGSPHWSCVPLVRWASSWRTRIIPYGPAGKEKSTVVSFFSGYDVHSQISALTEEIRAENVSGRPAPRAVVLPDTSLLLPVLHHLPAADINVSMGYPLARSPLFRLVECILVLQEKRRGTGPYAYHWKGLIDLLRHPYVKMLDPFPEREDAEGGSRPSRNEAPAQGFRRLLHHAERVIRSSQRYSRVEDIAARAAETYARTEERQPDPALTNLLGAVFAAAVTAWEEASSPDALALALQGLTDLMHDHGQALWTHFPIDAECLYRLTESVIPQLAHTALGEEKLPPATLFSVLRGLLAAERVPFEASPLVGDQVLGVLETRLLHFDTIHILDATEDRLPGSRPHDPLLPDSLRPMMGLPGARGRETVAAYNFFRLVNGAERVSIYWQEGVEVKGINDAKKTRSRFVEELLWQAEKERGALLAPEKPDNDGRDGPLRLISCVLPPVPREHATIPMTDAARERVETILRGPVSPSLLDAYLRCPAQFFYQRIGRIREVESVMEGRDPLGTGLFLHEVLRRCFENRLGRPITADDASLAAIRARFLQEMAASPLQTTLPLDDRVMLEEAGPLVLAAALARHEGQTPLFVEKNVTAAIPVGEKTRTLAGIIDRVDEQQGELLILDYKSGRSPRIAPGVWEDVALWDAVSAWRPGEGEDAFNLLAEKFSSIQLPAYVYMARIQTGRKVHDAAYVPLRMGESDTLLFGPKMHASLRAEACESAIPALLSFLLRHLENATEFPARPAIHCDWCLYKNLCIVTPHQR